jgi:secreted trypsin-like serine protease
LRLRLALLISIVVSGFALVGSAGAITGNPVPTGDNYNYVVNLAFYDESGAYLWRCTGTMLSSTVVLTAGHCTSGAASATLWADEGPIEDGNYPFDPVESRPPCTGYTGYPCTGYDATGTPHTYGCYNDYADFPRICDVGVVVLDEAFPRDTYGQLPEVGFLDSLATRRGLQDITFTLVGYGLQSVRPVESALRERFMTTARLVTTRSNWTNGETIQLSQSPGRGMGGTCFGDSGGPAFYDSTTTVAAITSYGTNANCAGAGWYFRIDQSEVLAFIDSYLNP